MATPRPPGNDENDEFKNPNIRKQSKEAKDTKEFKDIPEIKEHKDAPLTPGFRQRVEDDAHKRQSDLNPDPDRAPEGTKRDRDRP